MKVFIFQADIYCEHCGEGIRREKHEYAPVDVNDESSYDSDHYPKGPYGDGGGEADSPQHCGACGVFLENPLTPDGGDYVRGLAKEFETEEDMTWDEIARAAEEGNRFVLAEWIRFYLQWGG